MVTDLKIRTSQEFSEWLEKQRKLTGLNASQITRVLAGRLNGMEIIEIQERSRKKPKKLTMKRLMGTQIEDLFNDFAI